MKSPIPMIGDVAIRGLAEAAALRRGDLDEIWQPLAGGGGSGSSDKVFQPGE
jgi:hypothetical protein